ncbi:MAG: hypothetical protein FJW27_06950 [Acidimicrobiia bacterium]|nr:hypothetical protein [Acidimicrobiia bacterium]
MDRVKRQESLHLAWSLLLFVALATPPVSPAYAQHIDVQGQLSAWSVVNAQDSGASTAGIRYLPLIALDKPLANERSLDLELSPNLFATAPFDSSTGLTRVARARPYRAWVRFKASRYEGRVGLQKINFGSATLLRPLMWFDTVDPRDPLQITDGVYAGLFRSYFPNKATVWAWGLFGNTSLKGWEADGTRTGRPEVGGRLELPVPRGQLAVTTHHRDVDFSRGPQAMVSIGPAFTAEHRYALDGKWDVGVGVWFEGSLTHQSARGLEQPAQRALNVGTDYTFDIGNGLYALGEFFLLERAARPLGPGEGPRIVATLLRYPLGLLDSVSGIVYVDTATGDAYRFVSWQRTYDRWQFYVMGFWNPQQAIVQPGVGGRSLGRSPLAGTGGQVMAVFNHRWRRQW